MVEHVELGSPYLNNSPVSLEEWYNGGSISIGDTIPGKAMSFIKWNGLYVADRVICSGISWDDLDRCGFIFGRPIRIDGAFYLCRSLKAGAMEGIPNEWDFILNDLGSSNNLWHWKQQYFWGQETPSRWPSNRAVRGYHSARFWNCDVATFRDMRVGFRPVLEPLPPETPISEALIGHNLKIYAGNIFVSGQLISYSDYDLELVVVGPLPEVHPWIRQTEDTIFVDREAIVYLCKER